MIRVIRVLEYKFPDYDTMEKHMAQMAVPSSGISNFGKVCVIRSAILVSSDFEEDDVGKS